MLKRRLREALSKYHKRDSKWINLFCKGNYKGLIYEILDKNKQKSRGEDNKKNNQGKGNK